MSRKQEDADRVARGVARIYRTISIQVLRDVCDIATGGELDSVQLDIFVDMVESRLGHAGVTVTAFHDFETR